MIQKAARREDFENEVLPYLDILWQTALWLARNEDDADKLIQDLYFIAYRLWRQWDYFGNLKTWMFKALVKIYDNRFPRDSQASITDTNGYISESIIGDDILAGIFAELTEEIRLMITLSLAAEFSYDEIADISGVKTGIVRQNIYLGYTTLQTEIAKHVSPNN
jgi:RNA polymerase sigma-70 factor, ECF subfamily